jgi:hypothetical protein
MHSTQTLNRSRFSPLPTVCPPPRPQSRRTIFVFCDVSNLLVGGAQVLAARNGRAPTPQCAADAGLADLSFRVDIAALLRFLVGSDPTDNVRAFCFGSNKVESANYPAWEAWRKAGWDPRISVRSSSGREKEVDTALALEMFEEVALCGYSPAEVEVNLVAGDRDYVPVLEKLARRGFTVDVVCWQHVTAPRLRALARRFIALDEFFDILRY